MEEARIIRSRRKSIVIGIDEHLHIYVKVPLRMSQREIRRFLESKRTWIRRTRDRILFGQNDLQNSRTEPLSEQEIRNLTEQARRTIPLLVSTYARRMNVTYGTISIRHQKTRWGSCSLNGNLSFNCLLMLMPHGMLEYTVVHELCHRVEMNHSRAFYDLLEQILPDYLEREKWMKANGHLYTRLLPQKTKEVQTCSSETVWIDL
ncbi:MAG: M48 family metallopeptidase [Clostridia bacterium]|nr:M48 family metallopeptidase [Clostridia bacterium]